MIFNVLHWSPSFCLPHYENHLSSVSPRNLGDLRGRSGGCNQIKYIPIGDKIELNLGPDPEVIFELVKLRTWRDNIWMQIQGADVYRRVDEPGIQIEVNSSVAGWDDHTLYVQRVRNYTTKPIEVEVRRTIAGAHRLPQFPGGEELRLPDGRVPRQGQVDAEGGPAL